jgi:hypothetical protein
VVKRSHRCRLDDIETGDVSTGRTSISGSHALNGTGSVVHLNHATESLVEFAD